MRKQKDWKIKLIAWIILLPVIVIAIPFAVILAAFIIPVLPFTWALNKLEETKTDFIGV